MIAAAGVGMLVAVAVLLIATGLPAWVVLIGVASASAVAGIVGGVFALPILTAIPARLVGLMENDLLQALPLYVLMGALLHHLPFARQLFRVGSYALDRLGAGAILSGLGLGALLAPMNGSVGASVAMLARAVMPGLREANVPSDKGAALICVASTLGVVVPPSLVLILLADAMMRAHTEAVNATGIAARIVNTQDIFIGALVPAFILLIAYAVVAWWCNHRDAAPRRRPTCPPARDWIAALATLVLIGTLLAGVTLGYLYAVEAAATGGVALTIAGFAMRALTPGVLRATLRDTLALTGALFALLVGATTFTLVVRAFGTDRWLADVLAALPGGASTTLAVALSGLALCALVLDAFELIFVVVPILMPPVLTRVGDATWVAVLALLILELGFLMPPFGYAVLMIRKQLPERIPPARLARALVPYLIVQAGMLALVLGQPSLVWHRNPSRLESATPPSGGDNEARRMLERQLDQNSESTESSDAPARAPQ
jgi:tripartite ATP-independent transporter DctM subunit